MLLESRLSSAIFNCETKAGNKAQLAASATYPLDFGYAVAALIGSLSSRPLPTEFSTGDYVAGDDLGALDDFLKGRNNTWWRKI